MKALTLYQPWAQLMADGRKRIETRPWRTTHRGLVAIHAGKVDPFDVYPMTCSRAGYTEPEQLPRGAVVAVGSLVDCVQMTEEWIAQLPEDERSWGHYEVGRWGWVFEWVRPLQTPAPATGMQGLWPWHLRR